MNSGGGGGGDGDGERAAPKCAATFFCGRVQHLG